MATSNVGSRHRSLRDATAEELRRLILDGELPAGSRLTELSMSQLLGVSRLPVREAFRRLEGEGLLRSDPRRGVRVIELDAAELDAVREIRVALELMAVRRTVQRHDRQTFEDLQALRERGVAASAAGDGESLDVVNEQFHELLGQGTGSRFLADALRSARNQAHHLVGGKSAAIAHSWAEHEVIIEAVLAEDAEMAVLLMQRHLVARDQVSTASASPAA